MVNWQDNEDVGHDYGPDEEDYEGRLEDRDDSDDFADPGGTSALRAETEDNPRNLPCPTCNAPNRLTPADRARGYQCDSCADDDEHGRDHPWYDSEGEDDDAS